MTKLVIKDDCFDFQETIETPATEIIEEIVYMDENLIKNKDLIRVDINIVQFPIFSKNTQKKVNQIVKYYFNKNRDTYITVTPAAGDYIPGEAEEKIFIALMQLMKEKGMPKKFIISSNELKDKLKLNTNRYAEIVKKSLIRLSRTNYNFKNTMYSSEYKGTIKEEISTPILTLKILTLSLKENKKYRLSYKDKRIKELYEIDISDHFYNNVIQKGYLVYNSSILLEISTSTARTIYMLIEKLRFNNLYLKIDTMFLIKRIPLKYDKKLLSRTIKVLEYAFDELKKKELIQDFKFLKDKTWEKSEIEIFLKESSAEEKQQRFFEDRNDFRKLLTVSTISETEHDMIEMMEVIQKENVEKALPKTIEKSVIITDELIDKILGLMPSKARTLKTMPKTIKDAIIQYGYSKVETVAIYMKKNKVDKVRAYFIKALENNWCEDEAIVIQTPKKDVLNASEEFLNKDETPKNYERELEYFSSLSSEEKEKLQEKIYRAYIEECGQETKIQKLAFNAAKNRLIAEYILKNNLLKSEKSKSVVEKIPKEKNVDLTLIDDINYYTDYISKNIELYRNILNLSEERIKEIKIETLVELGTKIIAKTITLEEINQSIAKKLK
ncbi:hypothetical protein [Cetobacterium somerae]|uniref:hypothetical protein n=1 Tax=Cetobacterium somerae TaxID=188913 RepID=UPI00248F0475|nr:hypothetical protein [Cetobacterium somerae]